MGVLSVATHSTKALPWNSAFWKIIKAQDTQHLLGTMVFSYLYKHGHGPLKFNVHLHHHNHNTQTLTSNRYSSISPTRHDLLQADCLSFHKNRVNVPSIRNFKLVTANEQSPLMQFGCNGDMITFVLDFRHPLSPLQAFSISLVRSLCHSSMWVRR